MAGVGKVTPGILLLTLAVTVGAQLIHVVEVNTNHSAHRTDERYLSLDINADVFFKLYRFKVNSVKMKHLAKALGPAALRIGGQHSSQMIFQPEDGSPAVTKENIVQWERKFDKPFDAPVTHHMRIRNFTEYNHKISESQLYDVMNWAREVGWPVTLTLDQFLWDRNGVWDPYNARKLLEFSDSKGFDYEALQLTNLPNLYRSIYGISVTAAQTVKDLRSLRQFLDTTQLQRYRRTKVVGPDTGTLARLSGARNYMINFLKTGGGEVVDALTMTQHYMFYRDIQLKDFLDPELFKQASSSLRTLKDFQKEFGTGPERPVIISSATAADGLGAQHLSNGYCSTFIFLDELGSSALLGVSRINRRSFNLGYYGLLDDKTLEPNPDYWLSLVYKRLILGPVLEVTVTQPVVGLNVYAHCARTDVYGFKPGAIVVYYLNVNKAETQLDLSALSASDGYLLFQFTSIDGGNNRALKSNKIKMNGKLLQMDGDRLPEVMPVGQKGGLIKVKRLSFGFVVVNSAEVKLCM